MQTDKELVSALRTLAKAMDDMPGRVWAQHGRSAEGCS